MNTIIQPGAGLVFMKVGTHAEENLDQIFARKSKEIQDTDIAMWGYGGNTCHPRTMVQPFASDHVASGIPIYLCMEEMKSLHWAEPLVAAEYSVDGIKWEEIPEKIEVRGSKFALVIGSLERKNFVLPLHQTRVAAGLNKGRLGSKYVSGRVDKACLEVQGNDQSSSPENIREIEITLVAKLTSPYAVFLRGNR